MLTNFFTVGQQVLTLFLMMSAGFILRKMKKISGVTLTQLIYILLRVIVPCIIITSLQLERDFAVMKEMGVTALAVLAYFAIGIAASNLLFRKQPSDQRAVLRFGAVYPNNGFMGIPLVLACLGDGAMLYAAIFLVVVSIMQWTHGIIAINAGKPDAGERSVKTAIKNALLNPGTVGFYIGFVFFSANLKMPAPVMNTLDLLGDVYSPLAMIIIGAQIADADILSLFRQKQLYITAAFKQIFLPVMTGLVLYPFHLPPLMFAACVILAGTPVAAVTAMFAHEYGRDEFTAARLVSLSTLLSLLTLPVVAAIAKGTG
jgi:predicted permease